MMMQMKSYFSHYNNSKPKGGAMSREKEKAIASSFCQLQFAAAGYNGLF